MDRLVRTLREAPVVDRGEYQYFVHAVTDCFPTVAADLMREIAAAVADVAVLDDIDKLLTAEAMGIHHATAVTLETGVPFALARKRSHGFEEEIAVHQTTAYAEDDLYINGIESGDRLLLLDDVLSSGGTLRALYDAAVEAGAEPIEAVIVVRRIGGDGVELPIPIHSLVEVAVRDGEVVVVDRCDQPSPSN